MKGNYNFIMGFPPPLPETPITMYYIPNCKSCEEAAKYLKEYRHPKTKMPMFYIIYNAAEIGKLLELKEMEKKNSSPLTGKALFMRQIAQYTKRKHNTFPMIFKGNGKTVEFIGGWDDLGSYPT